MANTESGLFKRLFLWVGVGLIGQIIAHYYRVQWTFSDGIHTAALLVLGLVPWGVARFALGLRANELGLGKPDFSVFSKIPALKWVVGLGALIAVVGVPLAIVFTPSYQAHYAGYRWIVFAQFTLSTLLPWTFFHRGYLLFGGRVLLEREGVPERLAQVVPLLMVWISETTYHLVKPELESWGVLLASPLLSALAILTRSVWIPFFIHLVIEVLFFLAVH